jgi:aspartate aminotransferase
MPSRLADRMAYFDSSGIRKVFDLAAKLANPINLSIGQPHFEVPEPIRRAAIDALQSHKNGYALTQGMPVLREKLQRQIDERYGHADRRVFVTSGTSGGLVLAVLATLNPGDEVIVFDPYFVMYPPLVALAGAKRVFVDTYPDFQIDVNRVREAITPRTRMILFNSPANPTGVVAGKQQIRDLAQLAAERDLLLVSDELYHEFCYESFVSPAEFNPRTLVIDGFSKTYGITGWRMGFAHGPVEIIEAMTRLQQYTFVCAPTPFQHAGVTALEVDMSAYVADYRRKRDRIVEALAGDYQIEKPGGAFYIFPKAPWGTGSEFVARAIENELLIIPGNIFSHADTHFRLSYAADDSTIDRGIETLRKLARR